MWIFFIMHLLAVPMICHWAPCWWGRRCRRWTGQDPSVSSDLTGQFIDWHNSVINSLEPSGKGFPRRMNWRSLSLVALFRGRVHIAVVLTAPLLHELGHPSHQSKLWSQYNVTQGKWAQPVCLHCALLSLQVEMCLVVEEGVVHHPCISVGQEREGRGQLVL